MKNILKKIIISFLLGLCIGIVLPSVVHYSGNVCVAYAKNGFNKKPTPQDGFQEDKKQNGKVKAPGSNDYGYKDNKGRVWVPDGRMHGGRGWTRVYPDGSHDHVYEGGNVRVHNSTSTKSGQNWILVAAMILLLGVAVFSPIPGDEIIVGGALLGI